MRLIDADAAVELLRRMVESYRMIGQIEYSHRLMGDVYMLQNATVFPTIDAVPVVHARWVHRCRYIATEIREWCCSACGELPPGPNQCAYELRYCPRCGAKMDGGAEG